MTSLMPLLNRVAGALVVVIAVALPAGGQSTDEPSVIKRSIAFYEALKDRGVFLNLRSILPGSSLAVGADFERPRLFGTFIGASIGGAWSIRGYQQYNVRVGRLKGHEHQTELAPVDADPTSAFNDHSLLAFGTSIFVEGRQRMYPRMDFFGLGQDATKSGRSDYALRGPSLDLVVQWQRNRHFGLSGRTGVLALAVDQGTNHGVADIATMYSPTTAPGLDLQRRYLVTAVGTTLDYRDRPHLTTAGTFLGLGVWHADALRTADHRLNWTRLTADLRHFRQLRESHVLAIRGILSTRVGTMSTPAPFYLQQTLGGSRTLRGFGSYRLRGESLWSGTVEYRWRVHSRIELAPFLDVGAVADSLTHLSDARPAVNPGLGVRGTSGSRVIGRADLARSRDGLRVILTLSAPF